LTDRFTPLLVADVSGDPNAEVHMTVRQKDKWCFKYEPVQAFEVLHYVNPKLTAEAQGDIVKIVCVTLPGRQTKYSFCHQNIHCDFKRFFL
jgi:hypothetical protein